jgi:hypothetical protein
MPFVAATAIAFAQRQAGRYRNGECWTLVEDAVVGAGGQSSVGQTPNFGPNASYVWGALVNVNALQAGDVLQFSNYSWRMSTTTDVTNPDGSGSTDTQFRQETRGAPNHSALVVRVISAGIVEVVEQNIPPGTGPVQTIQLVLVAPPANTVTTRQASAAGITVTITTTTHTVSGAPRCYRPNSA